MRDEQSLRKTWIFCWCCSSWNFQRWDGRPWWTRKALRNYWIPIFPEQFENPLHVQWLAGSQVTGGNIQNADRFAEWASIFRLIQNLQQILTFFFPADTNRHNIILFLNNSARVNNNFNNVKFTKIYLWFRDVHSISTLGLRRIFFRLGFCVRITIYDDFYSECLKLFRR